MLYTDGVPTDAEQQPIIDQVYEQCGANNELDLQQEELLALRNSIRRQETVNFDLDMAHD